MKKLLLGAVFALVAGTASAGEFSVKGIRFGMSAAEVEKTANFMLWKSLCGQVDCIFLGNYTIGGLKDWIGYLPKGKLETIWNTVETTKMQEMLETFTAAYGKPDNFNRFPSSSLLGREVPNFRATWIVKDAIIVMISHDEGNNGLIMIKDSQAFVRDQEALKKQKIQNQKDF